MNFFFLTSTTAVIALAAVTAAASVITATSCRKTGETCLSFTEGTCCGGSSICNVCEPAIGYMCAGDSTTVSSCLAKGNSTSALLMAKMELAVRDLQAAADLILLQVVTQLLQFQYLLQVQ